MHTFLIRDETVQMSKTPKGTLRQTPNGVSYCRPALQWHLDCFLVFATGLSC